MQVVEVVQMEMDMVEVQELDVLMEVQAAQVEVHEVQVFIAVHQPGHQPPTCSQTFWSELRRSLMKCGTAPAFTTACEGLLHQNKSNHENRNKSNYPPWSGRGCRWRCW